MWLFKRNKEVKLTEFQEPFNKIREQQSYYVQEHGILPDIIVLNFCEFYILQKYFNTHPFKKDYQGKEFNDNPMIAGMKIVVSNKELDLCK